MRLLEAMIIAGTLAACTGDGSSGTDFKFDIPPTLFKAESTDWLVADKPDNGKIVVQRDLMSAGAKGRPGAPLPQQSFERTAVAYLAKTGRTCRINRNSLLVEQTWEFGYECSARPIAKKQ